MIFYNQSPWKCKKYRLYTYLFDKILLKNKNVLTQLSSTSMIFIMDNGYPVPTIIFLILNIFHVGNIILMPFFGNLFFCKGNSNEHEKFVFWKVNEEKVSHQFFPKNKTQNDWKLDRKMVKQTSNMETLLFWFIICNYN